MAGLHFTRTLIGEIDNSTHGANMNTLLTVGDINCDGFIDIVVAGRSGSMVWFENPATTEAAVWPWPRHLINDVHDVECGGLTHDLTGDGYPDLIDGGDWRSDELAWWENPGSAGGRWTRRLIARTGQTQFHDELIGDVTGDGRLSLVFWNQGNGTLYWTPLPENPRQSGWPDVTAIARDRREGLQPEEGLAIADIDGDGRNEIVAGTHWYKYRGGDRWDGHKFARGYISTLVQVGDLDGDGQQEIVVTEGDACIYGKPRGGKFAWFKPRTHIAEPWDEHVVEDFLLDPHSLQVADLCGNGHLDILVGEIGVRDTYFEKKPRLIIFENDGRGHFTRHVVDEGTGTHHARLADVRNRGVLDIVSRPLHGPDRWRVFVWYNNGARRPEA